MKILSRLILFFAFGTALVIVIAYARGYRLNPKKKSLTPTGILAISSSPKAAKIYINSQLKGATDSNLILPPGRYQVEIKKEGFTSWSKKVSLKGELVLNLEAFLFPLNPSLSPLTNLGVIKAVPLGQTDKILVFAQKGIYLFEVNKKNLPLFPPLKLIVLKENLPYEFDFEKAEVFFSPDYKQAIIDFPLPSSSLNYSYLFSLEEENKRLFDVTLSKDTLLEAWEKEKEKQTLKFLETFPKEVVKIASDSFKIISFSPDETKILYQAKKRLEIPLIIKPPLIATNQTPESRLLEAENLYVYDKKEDKNYQIKLKTQEKNDYFPIWYPDSKHLVTIEEKNKKKIIIIDYDGENKQTVYSGPFENSFFTVSDGAIIILTNLNPETNQWPDLYAVGIR